MSHGTKYNGISLTYCTVPNILTFIVYFFTHLFLLTLLIFLLFYVFRFFSFSLERRLITILI